MAEEEAEAAEPVKKKSRKMLIIAALVLLLGLGGGGFFFVSGGKKKSPEAADGATTTTTIALGPIVQLSPITLNLSDGHVLKVGLALQTVAKPKEKELATAVAALSSAEHSSSDGGSPLEGQESKALDATIHTLGDSTFSALSAPGGRAHAKEVLTEKIKEIYEGDIVEVYFTTFVMS
jgi:flagellar protein FliL